MKGALLFQQEETVMVFDDGYSWREVFGREALLTEGQLMRQCVGDYYPFVSTGIVLIYSLRDARNKPHVNVEVQKQSGRWTINQIKGKANLPVSHKYREYIPQFLAQIFNKLNCSSINIDGCGLTPNELIEKMVAVLKTVDIPVTNTALSKPRIGDRYNSIE